MVFPFVDPQQNKIGGLVRGQEHGNAAHTIADKSTGKASALSGASSFANDTFAGRLLR
jgi:hypothetical protein